MAQPMTSKGGDIPPPPYPGEPTVNYPNHEQVPVQPGWGPYPPPPPQYQYGSTTVTVQPGQAYTANPNATRIIVLGNGCPRCHAGMLMDSYDCLGIFFAIFFFPLGILCCLAMRQKRCTNCGATF